MQMISDCYGEDTAARGESKFTQTKDFSQFGKGKWRERIWATGGASTKTKPGERICAAQEMQLLGL